MSPLLLYGRNHRLTCSRGGQRIGGVPAIGGKRAVRWPPEPGKDAQGGVMTVSISRTMELPKSMAGTAMPPPLAADLTVPPKHIQRVIDHLSGRQGKGEYAHYARQYKSTDALSDLLFATPLQPHDPSTTFDRLRWGGLFVFASTQRQQVEELAREYAASGYAIEEGPAIVRQNFLGLPFPIPLLSTTIHYFSARKVQLIRIGDDTDRFTYRVELARHPDPAQPWVVRKEVPTLESVVTRLARRFPELPTDVIEKRARKFTEKIFPTFLTREAAILMILQKHLPAPYNRRVPSCLGVEKDERGFVRHLKMNWLRVGGEPISQMEFAHQSADLLRAVHDLARVIHLDLRLDNFVITPEGVGFVDFGSSVRDGENLAENPLLQTLFEELMKTSHIQQMLEKMTISGAVTSKYITRGHQKVDKAVDFFYLAVQFNLPHSNPELASLIQYDPDNRDARNLAKLTREILRPADPEHPTFRSAKDILHGIERIRLKLDRHRKRH
jgi:hypothetical protein